MKCPKCEKETDDYSKFCSSCGEKVEVRESIDSLNNIIKMCSRIWFILGHLWTTKKDDKKSLEEMEKLIRLGPSEFWDRYQELVNYIEESDKKLDEKASKLNQSPNSESWIRGNFFLSSIPEAPTPTHSPST